MFENLHVLWPYYPICFTGNMTFQHMIPSSDDEDDDDAAPHVSESLIEAVHDVIEPLLKLKVEDGHGIYKLNCY